MSIADPPGDELEVLWDGAGSLYAEADPLPDLPQVLEHARRLEGLTVTDTAPRWCSGRSSPTSRPCG